MICICGILRNESVGMKAGCHCGQLFASFISAKMESLGGAMLMAFEIRM
jgi:hypothetical protein